jgi:hypothetical protein
MMNFKIVRIAMLLFISSLLSACAFGPLAMHETGRTVGDGKHELVGGYGIQGLVAKWSYGLTPDVDIGAQVESLSLGVRMKYSFLNPSKGWASAVAAGVGESLGGSHYYGDLHLSYNGDQFEPYLGVRVVRVTTDPVEFKDENTGEVDIVIDSSKYSYGQAFLGSRWWFTKVGFLSLEASTLFEVKDIDFIDQTTLASLAVGARF